MAERSGNTASNTGITLAAIAAQLGGELLGDGAVLIRQVGALATAEAGEISFLTGAKYRSQLQATQASAVIVPPAFAEATSLPRIVRANPYAYYAQVVALLNPAVHPAAGIAASAVVDSPVPASVSIGAGVTVGRDVVLGERVTLYPGCVIGDGVTIGADTVLYPQVTVYAGCTLGQRVIIHSGTVIGADGFGFAPDAGRWRKIPQIGAVVIGDDVEIGANTTVDRGALDDTVIGEGCKLDNQIQIGHNCVIGAHSVIAGCVGIAGSTTLGPGCAVGGAAMILGHLEIAGGTVISPGSMVMKSISKPGKYTALFPLDEHENWMRNAARIRHLAALEKRVGELEKRLQQTLDAKKEYQ
jgi:UDP-3-O-[3-hydroxymyristoyl] glucosamine N-acyltransferase